MNYNDLIQWTVELIIGAGAGYFSTEGLDSRAQRKIFIALLVMYVLGVYIGTHQ